MTNPAHIIVLDSGAGGLSIAKTILQLAPRPLRLSYFADLSHFPYGNKDDAFLIPHLCELCDQLIRQHQPDLLVLACNTASTIALPELRRRFPCPFVGVVPAIKPAAKLTTTRCIGVLATPATVNRQYTHSLIEQFAGHCEVKLYGSDVLVRCAENHVNQQAIDEDIIKFEIEQLLRQQEAMDTVVLACTHFPLIVHLLRSAAPAIRYWVDSSAAIAKRTFQVLDIGSTSATTATQHETTILIGLSETADKQTQTLKKNYERLLLTGC